jgi:MoaA/NifB/PqqE/SkfB family radical SAM enzyme
MYLPSKANLLRLLGRYPLYLAFLCTRKARLWNRCRWIASADRRDGRVPPPLVYKLYLTLACNLRCGVCMLWGKQGSCLAGDAEEPAGELDWAVIRRIFSEAGDAQPSFILSGGEPLLYSRFADLADLLKRHRCFAYVCTNGVLIERHLATVRDNPYLIFYVSIDGPREINDRLRGNGTYDRAVDGIKRLKSLQPKPYVGVQITLQPENVGHLHRTCREMVAQGVDWILINLQWFVTPAQAAEYEAVLEGDYGIRPKSHLGYLVTCDLDRDEFVRQCRQIRAEKWPIQISSYLRQPEDIHAYLDRPYDNPYNGFCYKQWIRMDVLPDGRVTPCIPYPDLTFGSLRESTVMDIWNGTAFEDFRRRISRQPLPVCGRCYCLYLYDPGRHVL